MTTAERRAKLREWVARKELANRTHWPKLQWLRPCDCCEEFGRWDEHFCPACLEVLRESLEQQAKEGIEP